MSANTSEEKTLMVARKQNRLVDGSYSKLTLQGLRVFAMGVHKLRPGQTSVTFTVDEYTELLSDREDTRGINSDLKAVAKEIVTALVSLPGEQRGDHTITSWVETTLASSAELRADGTFQLEFSKKLRPYLEQLAGNYTFVELPVAMSLTSRHAFRLYEVARSWDAYRDKKTKRHRGVRFSLDDIYRLMGIENDEYRLFGHFKNRVLNRACSEIEQKSELRFRRSRKDGYFDELKSGKRVTAVRFTLESDPLTLTAPAWSVATAPGAAPAAASRSKGKAEKAKKTPATVTPAPAVDLTPELPFAGVLPSVVLREKQSGESVEAAAARLAEAQARKRVDLRRKLLDGAEQDATPDPEVIALCSAELMQAENELQELLARDQQPPEPEDDPRG